MENKIDSLMARVKSIEGEKKASLYCPDSVNSELSVNISAAGMIGHGIHHEILFKTKLLHALDTKGSLIITQLNETPAENIYGFQLYEGNWNAVPSDIMRESFTINAVTGEPIEIDDDLVFCD